MQIIQADEKKRITLKQARPRGWFMVSMDGSGGFSVVPFQPPAGRVRRARRALPRRVWSELELEAPAVPAEDWEANQ